MSFCLPARSLTPRCRLAPTHALVVIAASVFATASPARAWIFPEHAELTRFAFERYLPEPARTSLYMAIDAARARNLPLCHAPTVPFERTLPDDDMPTCVHYSALPALAGDHSVDVDDLRSALTRPTSRPLAPDYTLAAMVIATSAEAWAEFLEHAPADVSRAFMSQPVEEPGLIHSPREGVNRRSFIRDLDLRLQLVDHDYAGRAGGSRAHFQDALTTLEDLLATAAGPGNLDNALGQVLAHHIRSMQLAARARRFPTNDTRRQDLLATALLEHAFALHFMQDAFAAGHIGTEHSVGSSNRRLQRHDYLNRRGLSVTRRLSTRGCHRPADMVQVDDGELPVCWTTYGDGYLDVGDIPFVAEATARLQIQFAMAVDPQLATRLQRGCVPVPGGATREATLTDEPGHVQTFDWTQGQRLRIDLQSGEFDPVARVLDPEGRVVAANDDCAHNTLDSCVTMDVETTGQYTVEVSSYDPTQHGAYQLRTMEESTPPDEGGGPNAIGTRCRALREAFRLLDPAPVWTLSDEGRRLRGEQRDLRALWSHVVEGAERAASTLSSTSIAAAADAGAEASGQPLAMHPAVLGSPLHPCAGEPGRSFARFGALSAQQTSQANRDGAVVESDHGADVEREPDEPTANGQDEESATVAFRDESPDHWACPLRGQKPRYGHWDFSLWRPLLVAWPASRADVRTLDGLDNFGHGFAVQILGGAQASVSIDSSVPGRLGGWIGMGFSYRADGLFSERENRALFELNAGIGGSVIDGLGDTRYATTGFVELRTAIIPIGLVLLPGWLLRWSGATDFVANRAGIGLWGVRFYTSIPQTLGGSANPDFRFLGWDAEVAFVAFGTDRPPRTASIGTGMDAELRLRLGMFNMSKLSPDGVGPGNTFTVSLELSSGYSWFL